MKKALLIVLTLFCLTGFSNQSKAQDLHDYEYYNSALQRHFYTTNFSELGNGAQGFTLVGSIGGLVSTGDPNKTTGNASRAVYRFYNSSTGAHYYTMNGTVYPGGFHLESIMGYTPPVILLNPLPVYEYYDSTNHDYFYATTNGTVGGYTLNGIAYYVSSN